MRPSEALEIQADLLRFARSPSAVNEFERMRAAGSQHQGRTARERVEEEVAGLSGAETYLISDDMLALARHAAGTMPNQILKSSDLVSWSGFCVFGRPIGQVIAFRWHRVGMNGPIREGVLVVLYARTPDGARIGLPQWFPVADGPFPFESEWLPTGFEGDGVSWHIPRALWALMRQRIHVERDTIPERATRRRLARDGSPLKDNMIKVVLLRRESDGPEARCEPGSIEFSHRFLVSGHWRNQWCPKAATHRQTWIAPYVKGPADKPLVLKPTVNVLAR